MSACQNFWKRTEFLKPYPNILLLESIWTLYFLNYEYQKYQHGGHWKYRDATSRDTIFFCSWRIWFIYHKYGKIWLIMLSPVNVPSRESAELIAGEYAYEWYVKMYCYAFMLLIAWVILIEKFQHDSECRVLFPRFILSRIIRVSLFISFSGYF